MNYKNIEPYLNLKYFLITVALVVVSVFIVKINPMLFKAETQLNNLSFTKELPQHIHFKHNSAQVVDKNYLGEIAPLIFTKSLIVESEKEFLNIKTLKKFNFTSNNILEKLDPIGNVHWQIELPNDQQINKTSFSFNDKNISFLTENNQLYVINAKTGRPLCSKLDFKSLSAPISYENYLVYHSDDNTITIEDLFQKAKPTKIEFNGELKGYSISPKTPYLVIQTSKEFAVFNFESLKQIFSNTRTKIIFKHSLLLRDKFIYVTSKDEVVLFNLKSNKEVWKTKLRSPTITKPLYYAKSKTLAFYLKDDYVRTLNSEDGKRKWRLNTFNESVYKGIFAYTINKEFASKIDPDNIATQLIGTPCGKEKICYINPITGRPIHRLRVKEYNITGAPISFQGQLHLPVKKGRLHFLLTLKER